MGTDPGWLIPGARKKSRSLGDFPELLPRRWRAPPGMLGWVGVEAVELEVPGGDKRSDGVAALPGVVAAGLVGSSDGEEALRAALARDADDFGAVNNLAVVLLNQGRLREVRETPFLSFLPFPLSSSVLVFARRPGSRARVDS